jgi:hypothetical protein
MSSIDGDDPLRRFYAELVVPTAESLRAGGVSFFNLRPDPSAATYYEPRGRAEYIFEAYGDDVERALEKQLADHPGADLSGMAKDLVELARELHKPDEDDGDVSAFLYPMF